MIDRMQSLAFFGLAPTLSQIFMMTSHSSAVFFSFVALSAECAKKSVRKRLNYKVGLVFNTRQTKGFVCACDVGFDLFKGRV